MWFGAVSELRVGVQQIVHGGECLRSTGHVFDEDYKQYSQGEVVRSYERAVECVLVLDARCSSSQTLMHGLPKIACKE